MVDLHHRSASIIQRPVVWKAQIHGSAFILGTQSLQDYRDLAALTFVIQSLRIGLQATGALNSWAYQLVFAPSGTAIYAQGLLTYLPDRVGAMDIIQVIGELYRSDIDCGLESYRGFGVTAWIVDEHNRRVERHFEANELDAISEWLQVEAARQHSFAYDLARGAVAHHLLAELADSPRKAPKQVTHRDHEERTQVAKVPAGG